MENENEQRTFTGLARELSSLSSDKRRVALEMSAAIAGVSLRVSREFVEAVPKAAEILSADDLRQWADMGRKLAMADLNSATNFFGAGVGELSRIPQAARTFVFQICARQLVLSSSTAIETFNSIPKLADSVKDQELLSELLKLANEIAQRSAKHSSDFLKATPELIAALDLFGKEKKSIAKHLFRLAFQFASRTGGMTADLWQAVPDALQKLSAKHAGKLLESAFDFLEFGGSVTLNFVSSGGEVIRRAERVFDDWCAVLREVAKHGNAVLVSFIRASPNFFAQISTARDSAEAEKVSRRVLQLTREIAATDAESALAAFRASPSALRQVSLSQFEDWVRAGMDSQTPNARARRSFFALETRHSNDLLHEGREGLPLERVQTILRIYVEGLTGKEVEVSPLSAMPQETRINDGKTIYLPASVSEFKDDELDFRLYKVLAAHAAGQIEFGTYVRDSLELESAYSELSSVYNDQDTETSAKTNTLPKNSDYKIVLQLFPEPALARRIFGTLENARIDRRLRATYRGLVRDLNLMQAHLRKNRPYIFDVPMHQVPNELLFQITLCGGASADARQFYSPIVSAIESVVEDYLSNSSASVADTLIATSRVYSLFQNIISETQQQESTSEEQHEYNDENSHSQEAALQDKNKRENSARQTQDARDLFNAWNSLDEEGEPDNLSGAESWTQNEIPEQALESGEVAFAYDEWDRELADYRVGWSRVVEKKVKKGDRNFVELTRSRYRGVISSIRHQFQLMKPENLTKLNREVDGEDYDLNALVEYVVDRRADGQQSDRIYTKRLRRQRDVAVSLLLDQSSSTARTITRNPLQPYTHPGRRIIEVEKEGLVLMSEALEAVGDVYSISGFTSEGRRNVKFYIVKDFHEKYSEEIEKRIGGITFQNNTRLGAAIRHASAKLLKQESRTKLLIILTDGRPYDHDYGDARYAREDVREALTEAKFNGVIPFCITIDRESENELKDLYGDVGYTIIDDVLSLPERMPNIYRRLTS